MASSGLSVIAYYGIVGNHCLPKYVDNIGNALEIVDHDVLYSLKLVKKCSLVATDTLNLIISLAFQVIIVRIWPFCHAQFFEQNRWIARFQFR